MVPPVFYRVWVLFKPLACDTKPTTRTCHFQTDQIPDLHNTEGHQAMKDETNDKATSPVTPRSSKAASAAGEQSLTTPPAAEPVKPAWDWKRRGEWGDEFKRPD